MQIHLKDFDQLYLKSLPGFEEVSINNQGFYHTIFVDNKKAGIVGYIPAKFPDDAGFVQIIIDPEFRGQGLVEKAEDLLAQKYDLKILYATISSNNTASIKAHQKAGFEMIEDKELERLRQVASLEQEQIRLIKKY